MLKSFEKDSRLKINNQTFFDEIDLDHYVAYNALARIIFVDCHFEELDLLGKVFGSCDFKNCTFNNVSFRKCQFSSSRFESCQIRNSDFTRAEFFDGSFKNCNFREVDFAASDFWKFEFIETKFENSRLDLISAQDIKCWKSNELIEIKMSSNFKEILKNLECVEE